MLEFFCPHCQARLKSPERMVGQQLACLKCGQELVVPGGADSAETPPAPPAVSKQEPPPMEELITNSAPGGADRGRSGHPTPRSMRRSTSWMDLFDWKFDKYLTPWIIRFTWALSVVWAACVILLLLFSVASSAVSSDKSARDEISSPADLDSLLQTLNAAQKPTGGKWAWKLIGYGTAIVVSIMSLLWTRVVLECLIVVFNIAETATSIDQRLQRQIALQEAKNP